MIEEQRPYVHTHRTPPNLSYGRKSREVDLRSLGTSLPPPILQLLLPSSLRCPIGVLGRFLLMHGGNPHSFVISGTAVTRSGCWSPPSVLPGSSSPGPQQSHPQRWIPQTPASPGLEAARLLRPAGVPPCPPGFPELGHCPLCREGQLSL